MIADRFTVIIDACVLHKALERNMILSLAEEGLFRPRWSQRILDEFERSLVKIFVKKLMDLPLAKSEAKKQRQRIDMAFPESSVEFDLGIEKALILPDKNDTHVLAAAIKARAGLIVTNNLKHFPQDILAGHETRAVNDDNFIADSISLNPYEALIALDRMLKRFENPSMTMDTLISYLKKKGMVETTDVLMDILIE